MCQDRERGLPLRHSRQPQLHHKQSGAALHKAADLIQPTGRSAALPRPSAEALDVPAASSLQAQFLSQAAQQNTLPAGSSVKSAQAIAASASPAGPPMSTPNCSAAKPDSCAKFAVKTPAALERPAAAVSKSPRRGAATPDGIPVGVMDTPAPAGHAAAAAPIATGPGQALPGASAAAVELLLTSEAKAGTSPCPGFWRVFHRVSKGAGDIRKCYRFACLQQDHNSQSQVLLDWAAVRRALKEHASCRVEYGQLAQRPGETDPEHERRLQHEGFRAPRRLFTAKGAAPETDQAEPGTSYKDPASSSNAPVGAGQDRHDEQTGQAEQEMQIEQIGHPTAQEEGKDVAQYASCKQGTRTLLPAPEASAAAQKRTHAFPQPASVWPGYAAGKEAVLLQLSEAAAPEDAGTHAGQAWLQQISAAATAGTSPDDDHAQDSDPSGAHPSEAPVATAAATTGLHDKAGNLHPGKTHTPEAAAAAIGPNDDEGTPDPSIAHPPEDSQAQAAAGAAALSTGHLPEGSAAAAAAAGLGSHAHPPVSTSGNQDKYYAVRLDVPGRSARAVAVAELGGVRYLVGKQMYDALTCKENLRVYCGRLGQVPSRISVSRQQLEPLIRMGAMQRPQKRIPPLLPVGAACGLFELLKAPPEEIEAVAALHNAPALTEAQLGKLLAVAKSATTDAFKSHQGNDNNHPLPPAEEQDMHAHQGAAYGSDEAEGIQESENVPDLEDDNAAEEGGLTPIEAQLKAILKPELWDSIQEEKDGAAKRIADLEAAATEKDAQLAEKDGRIAYWEGRAGHADRLLCRIRKSKTNAELLKRWEQEMLTSQGVTRQDGGKGGGANRRAEGSMPAMQSMAAGTARRPASAAKRSAACWAEEPPSGKKPCRRPAECAEKALGGLRPASAVPNGTHSLAGGEPAAGRPQDAAARPAGNVSGGQTHAKAKPTGTGNPALKTTPAKTSAGVQAKQVGSKKQQIAAEGAAERTEMEEAVHLNASCQERSGGDARVRLSCPLSGPPKGSTVHLAHPAHSALGGVRFYAVASITDPDDPKEVYTFDLSDESHGAAFNGGQRSDGDKTGTLLCNAQLHALYVLPDGSKWAEHSVFCDDEDVRLLARNMKIAWRPPLAAKANPEDELFRKAGRYHNRLQNVEMDCWIFKDKLPSKEVIAQKGNRRNVYFWRVSFSPTTLAIM